ncbi:MAG: restriction endonuclease subunit S [Dissulfuribacterales bacterium]
MGGDDWTTRRLGDVVTINPDALGRGWPHAHISYIDISSVGEGQILVAPQRMKLADAPSRAKRLLRSGDTVLSTVRPNRRSMFFAAQPGPDWVVSTGFAVLRPQADIIAPRFLYACVFNQTFTEYLISREKGAAYPAVSPEDIANAVIPLPPLKEQQAIACILGALDDKIELNRQMNRTLEEMARAIFKSWFVDFDPVRAKASGQQPPGLKPEIAALFPDSFEDSELGEIPKGWRVGRLGEVLGQLVSGSRPKGGATEEGVPSVGAENVIGLGKYDFSKEKYVPRDFFEELYRKGTDVRPGDILLYKDGAQIGRKTYFDCGFPHSQCAVNEHVFIVRAKYSSYQRFFYFWLDQDWMTQEIVNLNSNSAQPGINQQGVRSLLLIHPPRAVVESFDGVTKPITDRLFAACHESRTLAALRDTLLPKLISGELRVQDAERIVGRCV